MERIWGRMPVGEILSEFVERAIKRIMYFTEGTLLTERATGSNSNDVCISQTARLDNHLPMDWYDVG